MDSERNKIMPNELGILDNYFKEVVTSNFKIEGGSKRVKMYPDANVFKGQIELPHSFISYKESDYYIDPKGQEFIHFTSLETFFKIINGGYFLATQFSHHDDPMELLFAAKHLDKVFNENILKEIKREIFSLSMCKYLPDKESFDMWRIYGNSGYGIGIVISFYENQDLWNNTFLSKVYYENERNSLDKFSKFQLDHLDFLEKNPSFQIERNFSGEEGINDLFGLLLAFHKKSHFKIEDEIRFLKSYLPAGNVDANDESLELLLNKKNEAYFAYRIPIVSKKNLNKIISENNLTQNRDLTNEIRSDISTIKNYVAKEPFIIIKKVVLGYRYTESDLFKFKELETNINRRVGGPMICFDLSELSKEFHG